MNPKLMLDTDSVNGAVMPFYETSPLTQLRWN